MNHSKSDEMAWNTILFCEHVRMENPNYKSKNIERK